MGTDSYQTYCGDHFRMHTNVKSLCSTPETNIILYVNYILLQRERERKEKKHYSVWVKVEVVNIRDYPSSNGFLQSYYMLEAKVITLIFTMMLDYTHQCYKSYNI